MGTDNNQQIPSIAIFCPPDSFCVGQNNNKISISHNYNIEDFRESHCLSYDYCLFLIHGANIEDSNFITKIVDELEKGVSVYYSYFLQTKYSKSKLLSYFDIYNKQAVRSLKQIIQCPILVPSALLSGFNFNKKIQYLHNFELLLYLTNKCMLKRSKHIIDYINPVNIDITSDMKILNEQSRS